VRIFVDQAIEDGFSADLLSVDVGGAGSVTFVVGDALDYALVRPGRIVVRLVFGQDGAQMSLAQDQHAVQEFTAPGCRPCVRRSRFMRGARTAVRRILVPVAWEGGVERTGEVRSAVADQEP
jgi:hypothetical protein